MKHLLAILVVLSLGLSEGKAEVRFGAGPHTGVSFSSFQTGISDYYGTGFLFGAHGDVNIAPFLTTRLSLDYAIFGSDEDKIRQDLATRFGVQASDIMFEGLNISIFSVYIDGKGKIATGSAITPYGLLGLGLNFISSSESKIVYQGTPQPQLNSPSASETKFGLNFGAGAEYSTGSVILFMEFKYNLVFTSPGNSSHIPIVLGATFPF